MLKLEKEMNLSINVYYEDKESLVFQSLKYYSVGTFQAKIISVKINVNNVTNKGHRGLLIG